jgi:hypothetical protein
MAIVARVLVAVFAEVAHAPSDLAADDVALCPL